MKSAERLDECTKRLTEIKALVDETCSAINWIVAPEEIEAARTRVSKDLGPIRLTAHSLHEGISPTTETWADIDARLAAMAAQLCGYTMSTAKMAISASEVKIASTLLRVANKAQTIVDSHGPSGVAPTDSNSTELTHRKDQVAGVTEKADTLNNLAAFPITGVGMGVSPPAFTGPVSPAAFTSGASTLGNVGAGLGVAGGGLGILFGLIGVGLGAKATYRGHSSAKQLHRLGKNLNELDPDVKSHLVGSLTDRAESQKRTKRGRGIRGMGFGSAAVAAGVLSVAAALTVGVVAGSLGIGAAVIGGLIAAAGIALVIYRWQHKVNKRASFAAAAGSLADTLIHDLRHSPDTQIQSAARTSIEGLGGTIGADSTDPFLRQALVYALTDQVNSARKAIAAVLVHVIVAGTPSDTVQAELLVEALHLEPAKLRAMPQNDAREEVARKIKSS